MSVQAYTVAFQGMEAREVEVQCHLASGLPASLTSPHLVHAGAELYGLIIRELSFQQWRELFGPVMLQNLLSGEQ